MLLRRRIPEKLADILIFCYLAPDTIRAASDNSHLPKCSSSLQGAPRALSPSVPTVCRAISQRLSHWILEFSRLISLQSARPSLSFYSSVDTACFHTSLTLHLWLPLPQRGPSHPCSTKEYPTRPRKPWAGGERPLFPGAAGKVQASPSREHPAMVPTSGGAQQAKGHSSVLQLTQVSPEATVPRPSAIIQSVAGYASQLE